MIHKSYDRLKRYIWVCLLPVIYDWHLMTCNEWKYLYYTERVQRSCDDVEALAILVNHFYGQVKGLFIPGKSGREMEKIK